MAEETVEKIISVQAKYESLAQMKQEILALKGALAEMTEGTAEYEKRTVELKSVQTDYNKTLRITAQENDAVAGSMNDLQAELGRLKDAWKNVAVGSQEYQDLTVKVNEVKEKINAANHEIGNYQDQVGQYAQGVAAGMNMWGEGLEKARAANENLAGAVKNAGSAMKLMSTNPVFGMFQLLLPVLMRIVNSLKENTTVIEAGKKALSALQPVLDVCTKVIETLAGWIDKAADYFVKLAESGSGTFQKIIEGAVGVGNVLLQYLLTPIRSAVEAFQGLGKIIRDVFKGDFDAVKTDAAEAGKGIKDAFVKGFSISENFAAGKEAGAQFLGGLSATAKPAAEEAGKEAADAFSKAFSDNIEIEDIPIDTEDTLKEFIAAEEAKTQAAKEARDYREQLALESLDKETQRLLDANDIYAATGEERYQREYEIMQEANRRKLALLQQYAEDAVNAGDLSKALAYQQQAADTEYNTWKRTKQKEVQDATAADSQRMKSAQQMVSAITSILSSVASAYQTQIQAQLEAGEISEEEAERQFESVKALQYATTWINTLASVAQIMADPSIPSYWIKIPLAAAQLASGIAQTVSIANTELGSTSTGSTSGLISDGSATSSASSSSQTAAEYTAPTVSEIRRYTESAGTEVAASSSNGNSSQTGSESPSITVEVTTESQNETQPAPDVNPVIEVQTPEQTQPIIEVQTPEQSQPVIEVQTPEVNPVIEVQAPEQTQPVIEVQTPESLNVADLRVAISQAFTDVKTVLSTQTDLPPLSVQAPATETQLPQTRVVSTQEDDDEERERQAAQRVYVVWSDINEMGRRVAVVNSESSF